VRRDEKWGHIGTSISLERRSLGMLAGLNRCHQLTTHWRVFATNTNVLCML
jgi:hypothetical protein